MDNASKALIMAGAILISVAIVGIGIYIFSAANTMTNDAVNTMESTQVQMFNNQFYRYGNTGDQILGSRAKEIIRQCKSVKPEVTCNMDEDEVDIRAKYDLTIDTNDSGYVSEVTLSKVGS